MLPQILSSCREINVFPSHTSAYRTPLNHCNEALFFYSYHYNWDGRYNSCLISGQRVRCFSHTYKSVNGHRSAILLLIVQALHTVENWVMDLRLLYLSIYPGGVWCNIKYIGVFNCRCWE